MVDEPFYAAFLADTGAAHPMRDAVLASQPTDPVTVAKTLKSPVSEPVFYQKHMAHHMSPDWPTEWMAGMCHVLLIRHPARVIASYARKLESPSLSDLGVVQQSEILARTRDPIVVDSSEIRANPGAALSALCDRIGIPWTPKMLQWPAGGHAQDGVWAAHWYGAVHRSTGFESAEDALPELEGADQALAAEALPYYDTLRALRIKI